MLQFQIMAVLLCLVTNTTVLITLLNVFDKEFCHMMQNHCSQCNNSACSSLVWAQMKNYCKWQKSSWVRPGNQAIARIVVLTTIARSLKAHAWHSCLSATEEK